MNEKAKRSLDAERTRDASPSTIVAVPVCNEQDGITACLDAFACQVGLDGGTFGILLFLNNCTDATARVVENYVGMPWPMRVIERDDPAASAGWARRHAMEAAAAWLAEGAYTGGVLLTSDADSRVGSDWVFRNLAALAAGADAVAGRIVLDPDDAARLPDHLHARGRLEGDYETLLTEIDALIDPQPGNPWPCHWSKSGATIAVRLSAYKRVGGMPNIPFGEDRAFIDAVKAHDLIVRHAPDIEVITSGRLEGRASGGVADTMRLRCNVPETPCDVRLERLVRVMARALIRRRIRSLHARRLLASSWLLRALGIPRDTIGHLAKLDGVGSVLEAVEHASRRMDARPVRPSELPPQINHARLVLPLLRLFGPRSEATPESVRHHTNRVTLAKAAALSPHGVGKQNVPLV